MTRSLLFAALGLAAGVFAVPATAELGGGAIIRVDTGTEEARLAAVRAAHPEIGFDFLAAPSMQLGGAGDPVGAGRQLWRQAVAAVRDGRLDDRPLYWARLAVRAALRVGGGGDPAPFEWSSRGMDDVSFDPSADYRVLITGFDPFGLEANLAQSNPSGLAVLALDGRMLRTRRGWAQVQGALMPVRFADFDGGLTEAFLEPLLTAGGLDLVVTISMGRDAFDLERFPGRRRSAAVADNLNVLTGATAERPLVPKLAGRPLAGAEFLEFTLPASAMRAVGGPFAVRDNRVVRTQERGELVAGSLDELIGQTAVAGSGGGYLSNEISYRALLANERTQARLAMGHLHTPRVAGYDEQAEARMLEQIEALILAAVEGLPDR